MERQKELAAFRRGEFRALVVSDLAARGLDVDDCDAALQPRASHRRDALRAPCRSYGAHGEPWSRDHHRRTARGVRFKTIREKSGRDDQRYRDARWRGGSRDLLETGRRRAVVAAVVGASPGEEVIRGCAFVFFFETIVLFSQFQMCTSRTPTSRRLIIHFERTHRRRQTFLHLIPSLFARPRGERIKLPCVTVTTVNACLS